MSPDAGRRRRALIYDRLSDNPNEKTTVKDSIAELTAYAAGAGIDVVAPPFFDDGVSAYDITKRRDGFERMRDFLRDDPDAVDEILCTNTSRLYRNDVERAHVFVDLRAWAVSINARKEGFMDLTTAAGEFNGTIYGAFNVMDSRRKSELVKAAARRRAARGQAHGAVLYGWRRVVRLNNRGMRVGWNDVVDDRAADVVREIVDRLLDGEGLNAIRKDLNARHIPTPMEGVRIPLDEPWVGTAQWSTVSVKKMAMRPANIGKRVVNREIAGDAEWPAIVDPLKHGRVLARFNAAPKPAGGYVKEDRRYLLTYGADYTCGVCGNELRMKRYPHERERLGYACRGGSHIMRDLNAVDEHVAALLKAYLDVPANVAALLATDEAPEDIAALIAERDRLQDESDALGDDMAAGLITRAQAARINAVALPKIDGMNARITAAARRAGSVDIGPFTGERWTNEMDMNERRRLLAACRVRVVIKPGHRARVFNPDSVDVRIGPEPAGVRVA